MDVFLLSHLFFHTDWSKSSYAKDLFLLLQDCEPNEVGEGVVAVHQQNGVQIAELCGCFTALSLLRLSQLLHLGLEVATRPRLQHDSNHRLVWAKQHDEDLQNVLLLFGPVARHLLDLRLLTGLEHPEPLPDSC